MATAFLIGRIIAGIFFLMNAHSHLVKGSHMVGYAASKGVPNPKAAIFGSGVLLLLGGLSLLFGVAVSWGIIALILFMVPVTFVMHSFWKESDPALKMNQKIAFWKNMAIVGFLLMALSI